MTKYLLSRILRSVISLIVVVLIVMVMIYSCLDRNLIFKQDPSWSRMKHNAKTEYEMIQWEKFGYVDYVPYTDWLKEQLKAGKITQEEYNNSSTIGATADKDTEATAAKIAEFTEYYKSQGYKIERLDGKFMGKTKRYHEGGQPRLYAYRDIPLYNRLWTYVTGLINVDNIHKAEGDVGERGIKFTLFDPAYGGEKFSPAIIGNGTHHKYLLYCNDTFPYIHQNLVKIQLGKSYSINENIDVFQTMTETQGSPAKSMVTYPTGLVAEDAENLHTATYVEDSLTEKNPVIFERYVDDYTNTQINRDGMSRMGYSFTIGILSVILSYLLGIPLGITMALKKDKWVDKLGTLYIVFIIAVPSLAYIFLFKAIGTKVGLPTTFDTVNPTWLMYVLPVISLALPSIANLMKWLRRYMIDQMNADYVKFARSGGMSEGKIFTKHILKNAIIPIVQGIPGSVLFALTGAIITERVYVVPGVGNTLTKAINYFDNGVIVGIALFYAVLTVISTILGDVLMTIMDPRISLTTKKAR